jgi:uncharacterized small protein (DUF1192 family)
VSVADNDNLLRRPDLGALTPDESLVLLALGRLALLNGPEDDAVSQRQKLRAHLKSKTFNRDASEALGRVLARLIEGGSVAAPEFRTLLIDLPNGKEKFKLVLKRGRKKNSRSLALEALFHSVENGRRRKARGRHGSL